MACINLDSTVDLPDMGCNPGADPYRRKLKLLLRQGDLWDIPEGGTFDRLLLAMAEEFSRFHLNICALAEEAPFAVGPLHDWRLETYEKQLNAYGIDAVVTDHNCDILHTDNATTDSALWHDKNVHYIIITVPELAELGFPAAGWNRDQLHVGHATADSYLYGADWRKWFLDAHPLLSCLNEYKQSHTAFMWREHPWWDTRWDIDALDTDNATADSGVYTEDWHAISIHAHPSFQIHEMAAYLEHPLDLRETQQPAGGIEQTLLYEHHQLTTDNANTDSGVFDRNWRGLNLDGHSAFNIPQILTENPILFPLANASDYRTTVTFSNHQDTELMKTNLYYEWEALPHEPH